MCFVQQFPVTMFTTVRHSAVLPPSQPGPYPAPNCLQLQLDLINCHLPMWHCNAGCKTKLMMISIGTYLCVLLIQKSIRVYLKFVYILYLYYTWWAGCNYYYFKVLHTCIVCKGYKEVQISIPDGSVYLPTILLWVDWAIPHESVQWLNWWIRARILQEIFVFIM